MKANQIWYWAMLAVIFMRELALSVYQVALAVLIPQRTKHSGIVAIPLTVQSEFGIAMFANLITLTPGTTSLHISNEKQVLYAHVMQLEGDPVPQMITCFETPIRSAIGEGEPT